MPDSESTTSRSPRVGATVAFLEYVRENDRLIAFQLALTHGAVAIAQVVTESIGAEGSTKPGLAEVRKRLGPAGTRAQHPDELLIGFHDSLIAEMLASRQVDNFLTYVVQLLALVFTARPELLRSQEQVRVDFVLNHPDKESLVRALIERRVDRLAYLGMRDLDEDLQERLGFSLFAASDDREKAVHLIEIRNVIVHNRGIVSKIAASRCSSMAPELGKPVDLTSDKLSDHRAFFVKLVREIDERAIKKFGIRPAAVSGINGAA